MTTSKPLGLQLLAGFLQRGCRAHVVALAQQGQLVERAQVGLVIDHKNGCGRGVHGNQTTTVSNSDAGSFSRPVLRKAYREGIVALHIATLGGAPVRW